MGRLKDLLLFRIKYEGKERYIIALYYFLISLGFMYGSFVAFPKLIGLTYSFLFASILMLSLCIAYVWDIVRHNMPRWEIIPDLVFGALYVFLFLMLFSLAGLNVRPSSWEVFATIVLFYLAVALSDDFVKLFRKIAFPQFFVIPLPPINFLSQPTSLSSLASLILGNPFYLLLVLIAGYIFIKLLKYLVKIAIAVTFIWLIAKALGLI